MYVFFEKRYTLLSRSKLINITLFCQPHHRVVPSSAQIVSKCPPTLTVL